MNLYIVRHAEPDYAIDSLTEKGWREARLLAPRLSSIQPAHYYVSPLGRAKDTASFTLAATGATAEECDWLREFNTGYEMPAIDGCRRTAWDMLPRVWADDPLYYDAARWFMAPVYKDSGVEAAYRRVTLGLDALLARHGYERAGGVYRAVRPNCENLILFCHFGVECVLLSHLMGCSPVVLWQHAVALPSSVSVLSTEEREAGTAVFRMSRFGDLSHLDAAGETPSFAARFCEVYGQQEEWSG